jgi:hypothetical protein
MFKWPLWNITPKLTVPAEGKSMWPATAEEYDKLNKWRTGEDRRSVFNTLLSQQIYLPTGESLADITRTLGFEVCEWGPALDDKCETCGSAHKQMWFSPDGFGEGCYWCLDCVVEMYKENEELNRQITEHLKQGHSDHCAARMAFGDGECECDLYAKSYDPYAWTKALKR